MREYRFHAPKSYEELYAVFAGNPAKTAFLAGGTDLVPRINMERDQIPYEDTPPVSLISLAGLNLSGIDEKDGVVIIGAMTTLSALEASDVVKERLPALAEAVKEMAGLTVRNAATIGGNIMNASPAADTLPVLMAMDAELTLKGPNGTRSVKADAFFTGPGKTVAQNDELLAEISVNPGKGGAAFKKLGRRAAESLSVVNAAAYVELENGVCKCARVAVGSAAPTVVMCGKAAEALIGQKIDEAAAKKAAALVAEELAPIDDIRATAWYRLKVAPVMAARAILAAAERAQGGNG